jgi:GNAT superfamily N-acetyltransferase
MNNAHTSREPVGVSNEPQPRSIRHQAKTSNNSGIRVVDTNSLLFQACMTLYSSTFSNDVDLSQETIKQGIEDGSLFVLCLPDQDGMTPIGVAIMADLSAAHETQFVMLDYFFVNPAKRGKGVGSEFFGNVVRYLQDNTAYECMILECVSKLVGFYEKLGAVSTSLNPSVCLVSKADLAKKQLPETLLNLMTVPLNSGFENNSSVLEKVLTYARSHVHEMTLYLENMILPGEKPVKYNVWSRC